MSVRISPSLISSAVSVLPDLGFSTADFTDLVSQLVEQKSGASEADLKQYLSDNLREFLDSETENFVENLFASLQMENFDEIEEQTQNEQPEAEGEPDEAASVSDAIPDAVQSDEENGETSFKRKRNEEENEQTENQNRTERNSHNSYSYSQAQRGGDEFRSRDRPRSGYVRDRYPSAGPPSKRPRATGATMQLPSGLIVPAPPMPPGHFHPGMPPGAPPPGAPWPPMMPPGQPFPMPMPHFQQFYPQFGFQQQFPQSNNGGNNDATSSTVAPEASDSASGSFSTVDHSAPVPPPSRPSHSHPPSSSSAPSSAPLSSSSRRLFVTQIPPELNSLPSIGSHFQQFGSVRSIQFMGPDKCMVELSSVEEANAALNSAEAVLGNRFIQVKPFREDPKLNAAKKFVKVTKKPIETPNATNQQENAKKSAVEVASSIRAAMNKSKSIAPAEEAKGQLPIQAPAIAAEAARLNQLKAELIKKQLQQKKEMLSKMQTNSKETSAVVAEKEKDSAEASVQSAAVSARAPVKSKPPIVSAAQRAAEILAAKHAETANQLKEKLAQLEAKKAQKMGTPQNQTQ